MKKTTVLLFATVLFFCLFSSVYAEAANPQGVITGDVFYKGIEVSRILVEKPESILGTPLSVRGPYYSYDGLEIYSTDGFQQISFMNLGLFEVNGVSLDKSREELIAAFGNPIEYYEYPDEPGNPYRDSDDDRNARYHVSSNTTYYFLEFWFDDSDAKANNCRVVRIDR